MPSPSLSTCESSPTEAYFQLEQELANALANALGVVSEPVLQQPNQTVQRLEHVLSTLKGLQQHCETLSHDLRKRNHELCSELGQMLLEWKLSLTSMSETVKDVSKQAKLDLSQIEADAAIMLETKRNVSKLELEPHLTGSYIDSNELAKRRATAALRSEALIHNEMTLCDGIDRIDRLRRLIESEHEDKRNYEVMAELVSQNVQLVTPPPPPPLPSLIDSSPEMSQSSPPPISTPAVSSSHELSQLAQISHHQRSALASVNAQASSRVLLQQLQRVHDKCSAAIQPLQNRLHEIVSRFWR